MKYLCSCFARDSHIICNVNHRRIMATDSKKKTEP